MNNYIFFDNLDNYIKEKQTEIKKQSEVEYNFGFIFEMYINLKNKITANDKGIYTASFLNKIYNTLQGNNYEEFNYENEDIIYKGFSGLINNFNMNKVDILNQEIYTHKLRVIIIGVIEKQLNPEFKSLLIKNKLKNIINDLNEYDSLLGCTRLACSSYDIDIKLISSEYTIDEI